MQAPDTAAFRAVLDSVFAAPAYRWAEEPGLWTTLREWWHRLGDWLDGLRLGSPFGFRLLIALILLALVLILAHAAYVAYLTLRGGVRRVSPASEPGSAAIEGDAAWYEREADRAAAEGRLRDALQLAFAALVRRLDTLGALRYHPSMTPAECAAAARLAEADRQRFRDLVRMLYAYVFAGRPCAMDDYQRWRAASAEHWQPLPHAAAH